ncbi:MAG TPA: hypothetical protein VLD65_09665 [Anaerolineales bacterium]|nr:hypothetical protein [Anaerolineales bacterium]
MQLISVRIKGKIDESWSDCFEGYELSYRGSDETILSGVVTDQAAFYGLIGKLRDLGLQLLEVSSVETENDPMDEGD